MYHPITMYVILEEHIQKWNIEQLIWHPNVAGGNMYWFLGIYLSAYNFFLFIDVLQFIPL